MRWLDPAHWIRREPTTHATRDAEWISSGLMVLWAAVLALPGNSFANPVFATFWRFGFSEVACGTVVGAVATMRLVALFVNGRSPRTPRFREIGAFLGVLIWMQLGVVVLIGSEHAYGVVPPVFALYAGLTLADMRSLFRASTDVRYAR